MLTSRKEWVCRTSKLEFNDKEPLQVLEILVDKNKPSNISNSVPVNERLDASFCSDVVFNLSKRTLFKLKISVLQKGPGFVPTFIITMRMQIFGEKCVASSISGMKKKNNLLIKMIGLTLNRLGAPKKGHPALELFHSNVEKNFFSLLLGKAERYNFNR